MMHRLTVDPSSTCAPPSSAPCARSRRHPEPTSLKGSTDDATRIWEISERLTETAFVST